MEDLAFLRCLDLSSFLLVIGSLGLFIVISICLTIGLWEFDGLIG